jgi:hypothetical protein
VDAIELALRWQISYVCKTMDNDSIVVLITLSGI